MAVPQGREAAAARVWVEGEMDPREPGPQVHAGRVPGGGWMDTQTGALCHLGVSFRKNLYNSMVSYNFINLCNDLVFFLVKWMSSSRRNLSKCKQAGIRQNAHFPTNPQISTVSIQPPESPAFAGETWVPWTLEQHGFAHGTGPHTRGFFLISTVP